MKKLTVITILAMMMAILSSCGVPSSMQTTGESHDIPDDENGVSVVEYNEPDPEIGNGDDF